MGSKYIKEKGSGNNSKYIKDKDRERRNSYTVHTRSDEGASDGLSGRARYLEMLEREREMKDTFELLDDDSRVEERIAKREAAKKEAAKKEAAKKEVAESIAKGKIPAETLKLAHGEGQVAFSSKVEAKPLANEDEDDKVFKKIWIRNIVTCVILGVIALLLQVSNFRLPLMPEMTKVDLSAIPELIAAVGFGPLAGIAVIIVKNIFYILFFKAGVIPTALTNIILDSVFVGITSAIYARGVFSPMAIERQMMERIEDPDSTYDPRTRTILKGGVIGALITTPMSYVTAIYVLFPLVFRWFGDSGYSAELYVSYYNDALRALNSHLPSALSGIVSEITTLSQGVLFYNLPVTFAKYIFVTVFVAIVFAPLTKFLFYQPTIAPEAPKKKKEAQK